MTKKNDVFDVTKLFGVNNKRSDDILDVFAQNAATCKKMTELYKKSLKEIKPRNYAEYVYIGYLFTKTLDLNNTKRLLSDLIRGI